MSILNLIILTIISDNLDSFRFVVFLLFFVICAFLCTFLCTFLHSFNLSLTLITNGTVVVCLPTSRTLALSEDTSRIPTDTFWKRVAVNVQLIYNLFFLTITAGALYLTYRLGGNTRSALAWFTLVGVILRIGVLNYFFHLFGKNLIAKTIFAIVLTGTLVWLGFGIKEGF